MLLTCNSAKKAYFFTYVIHIIIKDIVFHIVDQKQKYFQVCCNKQYEYIEIIMQILSFLIISKRCISFMICGI
ncbi:Hypothetical protein ERWE_CDS_02950 [Ehrlichia ruminantium str. Welgevonden]|uniref:Uncharacterized protein n=1 Tax=Ehrlichia ruminantium (strain Welgevonden) TaxID=254945 RepID=A0A0H3LZ14_EHRRW|nr:hypothetical protein AUR40_01170 [Ehrlichia ruminantium]CAI26789.1 Hypothetical protein ERWE_CDS_02950 [Ehrlichia ruminantium str. Welgevonden]